MKVCISSLFAAPLGVHHIEYLAACKELGDLHLAIVNNDKQVLIKGSCPFQSERERFNIVSELKCVDCVVLAIDSDGGVSETLRKIVHDYTLIYGILDKFTGEAQKLDFFFAKGGGDRKSESELPVKEVETCKELGIKIVFGVGSYEKTGASSSSLSMAFKWHKEKYKEEILGELLKEKFGINSVEELEKWIRCC